MTCLAGALDDLLLVMTDKGDDVDRGRTPSGGHPTGFMPATVGPMTDMAPDAELDAIVAGVSA